MSEIPDDPPPRPRPRPPAAAPAELDERSGELETGQDDGAGQDAGPAQDVGAGGPPESGGAEGVAGGVAVGADDAEAADGGVALVAPQRRTRRRIVLQGVALLLVVAVVAVVLVLRHAGSSGSGTAAVDQTAAALTDQAAANAFVAGATSDIAAVTSYDYSSLDSALFAGSSVATGEFRRSFRAALSGSLGAQATKLHRVQTFDQAVAGIGGISGDGSSASVLVFGTQTVTDDNTGQQPRSIPVTLVATVEHTGDRYLISRLASGGNPGLPPGTRALDLAAEAARETVAAVLTLRHDHIAADIATVLGGTADPLRSELAAQTAKTRSAVTTGGYDLNGTVTAVAVEQASGDTAVLLVAATGTRTDPGKQPRVVTDGRYEATVTRVGSRWLTSTLTTVQVG